MNPLWAALIGLVVGLVFGYAAGGRLATRASQETADQHLAELTERAQEARNERDRRIREMAYENAVRALRRVVHHRDNTSKRGTDWHDDIADAQHWLNSLATVCA